MALLLLSSAVAGGAWLVSTNTGYGKKAKEKKPDTKKGQIAERFHDHGTYGNVSQIAHTINKPGFIVAEKYGVDLSGAPCRWLTARNGGVYQTYDLHTAYF